MFKRLQQKWKASPLQTIFIITSFAIGGSITGLAAKKIMNLLSIEQDWLWAIIYILLITLIWPLAVIIVSIFFGQFRFFSGYLKRIGRRLGVGSNESGVGSRESGVGSRESGIGSNESGVGSDESGVGSRELAPDGYRDVSQKATSSLTTPDSRLPTKHIAIFASGAGSNAQRIIDHFRAGNYGDSSLIKIALVVSNKKGAGVLQVAEKEKIPSLVIEKERFFYGNGYLNELKEKKIDFIVLAGFLWKIPGILIKAYPRRIINIHPALLPKYGGQGMYGQYVHEAVLNAGEVQSGITIHYVDEHYDNGDIIFQTACPVLEGDTAETLANRIHALEYANYPVVIEELVNKLIK